MLDTVDQHPANQRLARHLNHERPWMFTFLHCPGLDATNNAAERAIRGMVIARKVWGGNRTWEGARTQLVPDPEGTPGYIVLNPAIPIPCLTP